MPPLEKIAYSVRDAAVVLGIRRASLTEAMKAGELPAYRRGPKIKLLRDDLVAWLRTWESYK